MERAIADVRSSVAADVLIEARNEMEQVRIPDGAAWTWRFERFSVTDEPSQAWRNARLFAGKPNGAAMPTKDDSYYAFIERCYRNRKVEPKLRKLKKALRDGVIDEKTYLEDRDRLLRWVSDGEQRTRNGERFGHLNLSAPRIRVPT